MRKFFVAIVGVLLSVLILVGLAISGCMRDKPPVRPPVPEAEPIVRVKIVEPARSIPLSIDGPFDVHGPDRAVLLRAAGMGKTEVAIEGQTIRLGSQRLAINSYCDLVPQRNGTITVNDRHYRGSVRLIRTAEGQLFAVNHVGIEDYLMGVLPGEMPGRFALEAFKAQAVTARTYALYERSASARRQWDVLATESSQMYLGKSAEIDKASEAVRATRGIVLTAKMPDGSRKIFPTFYSSTCGGRTQGGPFLSNVDPQIQPLQGNVVCDGCGISPHHRWEDKRLTLEQVTQSINDRGLASPPFQSVAAINVLERAQNHRITQVEVVDVSGRKLVLLGERFRLVVGSRRMPSTACQIRVEGSEVVFYDGQGLGHGVGKCQYGAEGMAQKGYKYIEILNHYYPGSIPTRLY